MYVFIDMNKSEIINILVIERMASHAAVTFVKIKSKTILRLKQKLITAVG